MEVVILAGGRGTRALPFTSERPKPLLPLKGTPLIEHVMRIYAEQGFTRFVIAVGHLGEAIEEHLAERALPWDIRFDRAGDEADTGTRLRHAARSADGTFLATYADGLADVDLAALIDAHRAGGRRATVTAVPLRSQFGTLRLDGDAVTGFAEKPVLPDIWINGGFFVVEPDALRLSDSASLESGLLTDLARAGELTAYRHGGFWRSVDTFKDLEELEAMVERGEARWAGLTVGGSS